jgi:hypothetical protein
MLMALGHLPNAVVQRCNAVFREITVGPPPLSIALALPECARPESWGIHTAVFALHHLRRNRGLSAADQPVRHGGAAPYSSALV